MIKLLAAVCLVWALGCVSAEVDDHQFHGAHLWGLDAYHEGGEEEGEVVERNKRQADEVEGSGSGDECDPAGNPGAHCFHGMHLWNLQPYHIEGSAEGSGVEEYEEEG